MQILGLLGMYFDAAVVEVKTFLLLFRLALVILHCDDPSQKARMVHFHSKQSLKKSKYYV